MGPPDEIKAMAHMVGTWDVQMQVLMDPTADFVTGPAVAVYSYVAGGACLQSQFTSLMESLPFEGLLHTTFNRSTGEWLQTWVDNIGGYMSVYHGKEVDGKLVLEGEDYLGDQVWPTRATWEPVKDGKFRMQLEHPTPDGKTWAVHLIADYTKRK